MDTPEILLASLEYLFPAVFHYYREPLVIAREEPVRVRCRRPRLSGFLRRHPHHLCRTLQRPGESSHPRPRGHPAAGLHRVVTEPQTALAKKIASLTPGRRLTKSFFTNSGTEANETAIPAARDCPSGCLSGLDGRIRRRNVELRVTNLGFQYRGNVGDGLGRTLAICRRRSATNARRI